ncbi:DUF5107 domain-containing protein [Herbiconiux moechotypicola]|uniref:DUF5107 domain-containing protein n=1 Tax=Herbiconiux moechotypicola TaxID=637393 RepID=UPI00217E2953|nr:DUF5107 domain-containing protein [Herbiconiux moechotypicola]MCS5731775.1 DUF5107 domain-containing protein [Herbiconiux moechotypicola]
MNTAVTPAHTPATPAHAPATPAHTPATPAHAPATPAHAPATPAHAPSSVLRLPEAPPDQAAVLAAGGVACWSAPLEIDTYEPAAPDRYPVFLDRRVYQGSSGKVYPMPFIDRIATEKAPRAWQAVHLENEYLRLLLLPEIGGRIHLGYDKTADYDFFYRNNVIKPALVGLAGPWISGGVEFNWPQHHRPGTFLPVDTRIERGDDGAVTVWHSDIDPLQRMRGLHGVRLTPGSSLIEVLAELTNRTDEPQTFLWWANVAARSHERYQSFFPTDVRYVADHARRAVTAFPRADRPYYGVDYPALVDAAHPDADRLDIYTSIPVPTSYMVTDTVDDFFGGYDHDAQAGFVHWADRAISPGKKQWTWGNGPIGHAWDEQLTDGDGPYVELMAGVYTDNQPDFSYLAPGETRGFSQFWYPIQRIGPAHQANRELAVSLEVVPDARGAGAGGAGAGGTGAGARDGDAGETVRVGVASAIVVPDARVVLVRRAGTDVDGAVGAWTVELAPGEPFLVEVVLPAGVRTEELTLTVEREGETLIEWTPRPGAPEPGEGAGTGAGMGTGTEPWTASEPPAPEEIVSADELYLTGVHLQQYRHPTRSAVPYFEELLRRDPLDSRASTALGAWHHRRGEYREAVRLFENALTRLTARNLNPASGETSYRLGLSLERLGELDEAHDRFAKAAWDGAWAVPAGVAIARLALRRGDAAAALGALAGTGSRSAEPERLKVMALRRLGRVAEAEELIAGLMDADPLDPATRALAGGRAATAAALSVDPKAALLVACDWARAGLWAEAVALTDALIATTGGDGDEGGTQAPGKPAFGNAAFGNPVPLAHYLRASWFDRLGDAVASASERGRARGADTLHAFPAGLDEYDALQAAIDADPGDAVAHALLGAWLLDAGRTDDARDTLATATQLGSTDPVAWRNAAIALVNSGGDPDRADELLARALELSPGDARLVFERDVLAGIRGVDPAERLLALEREPEAVARRDDLALSHLGLLLDAGRVDEALSILGTRRFQPFEGGEGKAIAAYDRATLAVARRLLVTDARAAVELLRAGIEVPANLGEGRHPAGSMAERFVLLGDALDSLGETAEATAAWRRARSGAGALDVAPRPVEAADFWVGVAHLRLGETAEADALWAALDARAAVLETEKPKVDYFATSLPELLLFDTDTSGARARTAALLRDWAARGRSLAAGEDAA